MLTRTFEALENEVDLQFIDSYGVDQAMQHKRDTLEPYMDLAYALAADPGSYRPRFFGWLREVLVVNQIDDDVQDFEEDLAEKTVNVAIGFYHENLEAGQGEKQAKAKALQQAGQLSAKLKVTKGYYLLGITIMALRKIEKIKQRR